MRRAKPESGEPGDAVWVGIDVGTQGVRVLAATGSGTVVGRGTCPLSSRRTSERHEQDPEEWWRAVGTASRAAMDQVRSSGLSRSVCRLAVCATSGTLAVVDRSLRPLLPALMYDDPRASADGARTLAKVAPEVWDRIGVRPQPSWALPRLAWLGRNASAELAKGRVMHQADFVTSRIADSPMPSDTSHALKSGIDPVAAEWPSEVVDALELSERTLPRLTRPGTVIGTVAASGAAHTGIPEGTEIVAGMTDGCAAQLAAGALTPGTWNSVLGTTLVFKGVSDQRISDPGSGVYSHYAPDGRWWPGGASSIGAGVLNTAFPGADLAAMDAAAALDRPAGSLVYPLPGRGERFPFVAPDAVGFTSGEPRDELDRYAATLQGVAYVERLCVAQLNALGAPVASALRLTGGAARSGAWNQLRADVLGLRVEVPEVAEPAFGMALLAASSESGPGESGPSAVAGESRLAETARRMVRLNRVVEPRPEVTQHLMEGYSRLVAALDERGWLPGALSTLEAR